MPFNPRDLISSGRIPLPIIGAVAGVVLIAIVLVLVVVVVAGGGGSDGGDDDDDQFHAGLATGVPTPEATVNLAQPTVVAENNLTEVGANDRLVIPKLGVDASLSYKKVPETAIMPDPATPDEIAYYDFSALPGLGGGPGRGGKAVFSGHVDSGFKPCKNGTVPPPCLAVLSDLRSLRPGDDIQVVVGGQTYNYRVTANESFSATTADWTALVSSTQQESIAIITCGGSFSAGEYDRRQVVTADRV